MSSTGGPDDLTVPLVDVSQQQWQPERAAFPPHDPGAVNHTTRVRPTPQAPHEATNGVNYDDAFQHDRTASLVNNPKRSATFYFLWTGWGLSLLILAQFAMVNVITLPWWIVDNGQEVKDVFVEKMREQKASFWVGYAFCTIAWMGMGHIIILAFASRRTSVPKTPLQILKGLLGGLPRGSIMVSYTSRDLDKYHPEIPRRVARTLPCRWLDQDSLLPVIPLQIACQQAAEKCEMGIIFVCKAYLLSSVCRAEFRELVGNNLRGTGGPKRNIIFILPDVMPYLQGEEWDDHDRTEVDEILTFFRRIRKCAPHPIRRPDTRQAVYEVLPWQAGHTLQLAPQQQPGESLRDPGPTAASAGTGWAATSSEPATTTTQTVIGLTTRDWALMSQNPSWAALQAFHMAGTFTWLGQRHTPYFFEEWRATASMLLDEPNGWTVWGVLSFSAWLVPIICGVAGSFYKDTNARVGIAIVYFTVLVPVTIFLFIMFRGLVGAAVPRAALEGPASLLIVLWRLGITERINVDPGRIHRTFFEELARIGVINLAFNPKQERHLRFANAEDVVQGKIYLPQDELQHAFPMLWGDVKFKEFSQLPQDLKSSWVHPTSGTLAYSTMCSMMVLFALDHRALRGTIAGVNLSFKPSKYSLGGITGLRERERERERAKEGKEEKGRELDVRK